MAGPFIKKNPEQFNKSINSARHLENPVQIMDYTEKKYYALLDVLREISKKDKAAFKEDNDDIHGRISELSLKIQHLTDKIRVYSSKEGDYYHSLLGEIKDKIEKKTDYYESFDAVGEKWQKMMTLGKPMSSIENACRTREQGDIVSELMD